MILYLPPGPVFRHDAIRFDNGQVVASRDGQDDHIVSNWSWSGGPNEVSPQHTLASTTLSTVVTVNYRLGIQPDSSLVDARSPVTCKFPTPVHDTLAGLDWILHNLHPTRLSVFGNHVGGSLALMLALTEASVVKAIAVFEPICDWVGLDNYCLIHEGKTSRAMDEKMEVHAELQAPAMQQRANLGSTCPTAVPPDLTPLLRAREGLFDTPGRYFDPFASPILFLRSPDRDCPDEFPTYHTGPEYPVPVLKKLKPKTDHMHYGNVQHIQLQENVEDEESHPKPVRFIKWPPIGFVKCAPKMSSWNADIRRLQVSLPMVRIFARDTEASGCLDRANSFSFVKSRGLNPDGQDLTPSSNVEDQEPGNKQDTVLMRQAEEMVSLMRRACFWGREKGRERDKVTLVRGPPSLNTNASGNPARTIEEEAAEWFRGLFEEEHRR